MLNAHCYFFFSRPCLGTFFIKKRLEKKFYKGTSIRRWTPVLRFTVSYDSITLSESRDRLGLLAEKRDFLTA